MVLQKSLFVVGVFVLVAILCWSQAERVLLLIGQDPTLSSMAAHFLTLVCPTLVFGSLYMCISIFMTAQGAVHPMLFASMASLLLCPALSRYLILTAGLGFSGAPVVISLVNLVSVAILCLWMAVRSKSQEGTPAQIFHGWTFEAFNGLGDYLKTAMPIVGVVCCEWWAYEVLQLAAGWLPNPHLAAGAMGISNGMANLLYMLPAGIAAVTTPRISNELGANRPGRAFLVAKMGFILVVSTLVVTSLVNALFREQIAVLWTSDIGLQKLAVQTIPLVGITEVFSGINTLLFGVLRAYDREKVGLSITIVSYWMIGLPLSMLFGFSLKFGVVGFWWGLLTGGIIGLACFLWVLKDIGTSERTQGYTNLLRK